MQNPNLKNLQSDPTNSDRSAPPENDRARLDAAIARSCDHHFATQYPEGYWVEELESNVTITAEYIFLLHFLGLDQPERKERIKNYLLAQQRDHGGWTLYYGGPPDIGTTVEAYVALKMCGLPLDAPEMAKARQCIFSLGGVRKARVFTKIFLAMLGQIDWKWTPATPVEAVLLPTWFYFNIYEMSSWSRGTVVPLSVVCSLKPVWPLPTEQSVPEIFTGADRDMGVKNHNPGLNWSSMFMLADRVLKLLGKSSWKPFRKIAMRRAEKWILKHQEPEGDFSGIQPAMFNSVLALNLMGYPMDHPAIVKGMEGIDRFFIRQGDQEWMQACVSPLWDTAISCNALMDAGVPGDDPRIVKAVEWMMKKQVTRPGDWKIKNPHTPPGGWSFEFYNEAYPDTDDTAEILMSIHRTAFSNTEWKEKEFQRALTWLMSMQSSNGGWGAFDQDNDHELFNEIPFADHGAMLDPPTVDVTGRILWMLGRIGHDPKDPRIEHALTFIRDSQEREGCWFGRWGVNYIYGTWLVLMGLSSIGEDMQSPMVRKAVDWLNSRQNADGGWGETCHSYSDYEYAGKGDSTKSQTAWALMALVEAGEVDSEAVRRGVEYLIATQLGNGSWYEDEFTGTGFPEHFYIRYHMYRQFFPLMALARYRHVLDHGTVPPRTAPDAG
ncbi:squalene--hopene cyclase [Nitrospina gracilis]|uniref:squalene--hopene cyclase n=1 Tax=Nitrospina gracilis TaxID=35801 RepID=UPI001F00440A|nr:squalene--hopene cyclase [Nitrospina gracilis]MCF8719261.1 squalene-hopene/tetraprenyl-beta-curcumene cyclase [Nitrospina gracilis Nb-211]